MRVLLLTVMALLLSSVSASAQDEKDLKTLQPGYAMEGDAGEDGEKQQTDISEIPPEYLEEMNVIYQDCAGNGIFSTYYDCKCQAMLYLEERIAAGPERHRSHIMQKINRECANTAGIAGYSHGVCTEAMMLRNFRGYEELCECFANTVANEYARRPALTSRNVISLQRDAYISCGLTEALVRQRRLERQETYR